MAVRCGDTTIIQILTIFVFHGGKLLDDYGRHPAIKIKAHNSLVHLINNCVSIDCILKKRCVKKLYILFCKMNSSNNKIIRKPTVCFITHVAG